MGCGAPPAWQEMRLPGLVHPYTPCHYGGEAFLKETSFTLILGVFDGADTLFLSRLKGVEPDAVRIGMPVVGRFAKPPACKVAGVWFEPEGKGGAMDTIATREDVNTRNER